MGSESDMVPLAFYNYTAETQPLKIDILPENEDTDSTNAVVNREFEIPPPQEGESAGVVRELDIVQRRRYVIRVLFRNGNGQWHHHHFYPDDSDQLLVRIYREEETESLYARFR